VVVGDHDRDGVCDGKAAVPLCAGHGRMVGPVVGPLM
jgi:hypothetical protein